MNKHKFAISKRLFTQLACLDLILGYEMEHYPLTPMPKWEKRFRDNTISYLIAKIWFLEDALGLT